MSTIAKTPEAYLSNILLGEYVIGLLPKGTHEYELFLSLEDAMKHVEESEFLLEAKGVMVTNPLTMEMSETNYLRANYMVMCRLKL